MTKISHSNRNLCLIIDTDTSGDSSRYGGIIIPCQDTPVGRGENGSYYYKSRLIRKSLHHNVTAYLCTAGDNDADLGEYEPTSFVVCCFAPHTFLPEFNDDDDYEEEYPASVTPEEVEARHGANEDGLGSIVAPSVRPSHF